MKVTGLENFAMLQYIRNLCPEATSWCASHRQFDHPASTWT